MGACFLHLTMSRLLLLICFWGPREARVVGIFSGGLQLHSKGVDTSYTCTSKHLAKVDLDFAWFLVYCNKAYLNRSKEPANPSNYAGCKDLAPQNVIEPTPKV